MSHERVPEAALTRVLVIDANPMVSELLVVLLRGQPGLECTGRAHTTSEAHRRFTLDHPDVVVLPAHVGTTDGLDLATELLELDPAARVVVTSGSSDCAQVLRAARIGVCAYLPLGAPVSEVIEAIRTARAGTISAPVHLVAALDRTVHDASLGVEGAGDELTPREREVLALLADGLTVDRISRRLTLSVHTTRGYVKNLLAKLEAHSQLEAVAVAKRRGLLRSAS